MLVPLGEYLFKKIKIFFYMLFSAVICFVWGFSGASEPRGNMAYMNRLGIWGEGTPFKNSVTLFRQ